nr:MAG: hypothetical protein [Bacteriophage sp.]
MTVKELIETLKTGVKMIEATPMRASMALSAGYKIGNAHPDDIGTKTTNTTLTCLTGFVLQWAKYGLKR